MVTSTTMGVVLMGALDPDPDEVVAKLPVAL